MTPISNGLSPGIIDVTSVGNIDASAGRERLEAVGAEFESVFLSMMIKEMRKSLDGGGFFGQESSDTYGGLFDLFIGKHLAEAKPLGIGEMLLQQYDKQQVRSEVESAEEPNTRTA